MLNAIVSASHIHEQCTDVYEGLHTTLSLFFSFSIDFAFKKKHSGYSVLDLSS